MLEPFDSNEDGNDDDVDADEDKKDGDAGDAEPTAPADVKEDTTDRRLAASLQL